LSAVVRDQTVIHTYDRVTGRGSDGARRHAVLPPRRSAALQFSRQRAVRIIAARAIPPPGLRTPGTGSR
jgi:hypothetical protein